MSSENFKTVNLEDLKRIAVEDFAVDVHHKAGYDKTIEALEADGVTWELFTTAHPEYLPEVPEAVVPEPVGDPAAAVAEIVPTAATVRTKERDVNLATTDMYLIKMERENPLFEYGKYRFTQEHPFVAMPADAANGILTREDGFRIATPAEAQEYYG